MAVGDNKKNDIRSSEIFIHVVISRVFSSGGDWGDPP